MSTQRRRAQQAGAGGGIAPEALALSRVRRTPTPPLRHQKNRLRPCPLSDGARSKPEPEGGSLRRRSRSRACAERRLPLCDTKKIGSAHVHSATARAASRSGRGDRSGGARALARAPNADSPSAPPKK